MQLAIRSFSTCNVGLNSNSMVNTCWRASLAFFVLALAIGPPSPSKGSLLLFLCLVLIKNPTKPGQPSSLMKISHWQSQYILCIYNILEKFKYTIIYMLIIWYLFVFVNWNSTNIGCTWQSSLSYCTFDLNKSRTYVLGKLMNIYRSITRLLQWLKRFHLKLKMLT